MSYADIIKKKQKEWDAPDLMTGADADRSAKIPFSSPLLNWATYGGIPRNKITEFHGAPGGGKAQPLYSRVLTPSGWRPIGNIKVGDAIFDGNGQPTVVDGVYPRGKRQIYKISLIDGTSFCVADDHLNVVSAYNCLTEKRQHMCVTTTTLIQMMHHRNADLFEIKCPQVDWPAKEVMIHPYIMGLMLGGAITPDLRVRISDTEVLTRLKSLLLSTSGCYVQDSTKGKSIVSATGSPSESFKVANQLLNDVSSLASHIAGNEVSVDDLLYFRETNTIKPLGIGLTLLYSALHEYHPALGTPSQHIPNDYLMNSEYVRKELLAGLMDSGCISREEGDTCYSASTESAEFSSNLSFLVRSLGQLDAVAFVDGRYWHNIEYHPELSPLYRTIIDIEDIGKDLCCCIHVQSSCHTYITDNMTLTHNTTTAVDICKNAINVFKKEYEDEVAELRQKVASGKKEFAGPLEDLIERGPKKVLYLDLEHAFDQAWSKKLGIDKGELDIMQPPDIPAEEVLQTTQEIIETGEIGLVVLDSLPSLVTKAELEKKYGERTVSALAGLLTIFMRKIVSVLTRYQCTFLMINQIRDNMDNPYVVSTPGGQAPKFYSSLRMLFKLGTPVDFVGNELPSNTENPAGYIVNAKIVKQKSAPFDRKMGTYYLMMESGIRADFDYGKLAIAKYGIVKKAGAWFTMCDPETGEVLSNEAGAPIKVNGMAKVFDYFQAHPDYYAKVRKYINDDIFGTEDEMVEGALASTVEQEEDE